MKSLAGWTQARNGVLPHSTTRRRLFPLAFFPVGKHPVLFLYNFMYLFLAVLGLPSCTSFSLVAESGSYSLVVVLGFSLQYRLLLWSTGSRAQAPWLWHMGLVAAQHVGSFWIRDQTCVFCTGRQILPLSHQGSPGSFS